VLERLIPSVRIGAAAASMLVLAACASGGRDLPRVGVLTPPVVSDPAPIVSGTMRPYQIRGRWYHPAHQPNYEETGQASWYGPGFHGRPTATGERFDENALTAAHKTLPLPGLVEVTNLANGRSAILRLNDRGPFVDDRIIDLSRGAATELGLLSAGVGQVRVRYLGPAPRQGGGVAGGVQTASRVAPAPVSPPVAATATSIYWIQAGSFEDRNNARAAARRLGDRARMDSVHVNGRRLWRVMVGPWGDPNQAEQARRGVIAHGFADAAIVGG
jgi:rare lipoprotein A